MKHAKTPKTVCALIKPINTIINKNISVNKTEMPSMVNYIIII